MAAKDPVTRVLSARQAAAERWGRTVDRTAATQPARDGLMARFERLADPDNVLTEVERARRADSLLRAHMIRMSLAASRARVRRNARGRRAMADKCRPGPVWRRRDRAKVIKNPAGGPIASRIGPRPDRCQEWLGRRGRCPSDAEPGRRYCRPHLAERDLFAAGRPASALVCECCGRWAA